jgi:hypothetical protein
MPFTNKFRTMHRPQQGVCTQAEFPCIRPDTLPSRRWLSTVKGENGNQVEDSISITPYLTNSYGFSLDSFYPVTLMKQNGDHTCYDRHQDDVSEKDFMLQRYLPTMLSYILHL